MAGDDEKKSESKQAPGDASNVAPFAATGRGRPCPICGRPSVVEMRPFCSKRCADVDLNRWLSELYRVPSDEPPASDEGPATPDDPAEKP